MKKAIIIAPFWRYPGHVGNYRVDRFVRWLRSEGYEIVLIRAGSKLAQRTESWGIELTVPDPLGLHSDTPAGDSSVSSRRPNKLRRFLAYILFNPDPGLIWCQAVIKNDTVKSLVDGATLVLSSSPPESSHLAAAGLAKFTHGRLVIDLRDGWLDDPLKPLVQNSRLQRWREGRVESRILRQADRVFVTSTVWQTMLINRLAFCAGKTAVLTNGYPPPNFLSELDMKPYQKLDHPTLTHGGRFTGSRSSQTVSTLLAPLCAALNEEFGCGVITLVGRLETADLEEVDLWKPQLELRGWRIDSKPPVSRKDLVKMLSRSSGLLLMSASNAAVPSKLFEYLLVRRPILAVTPKGSALWQICASIEQVFLVDNDKIELTTVQAFLKACNQLNPDYQIPDTYTERHLRQVFIDNVTSLL